MRCARIISVQVYTELRDIFGWLLDQVTSLLWQQSGSQISFELTGVWAAEAVHNRYGKLLDVEIEMIRKQIDEAHPVFGDRHNTLTVIGLPHACKIFADALETAFCTEEESSEPGNVVQTLLIRGQSVRA